MKKYTQGFSVLASIIILAAVIVGLIIWNKYRDKYLVLSETQPLIQPLSDGDSSLPEEVSTEFGDDGDEGGTVVDPTSAVTEGIVGKWQSIDDANFVREFKAGGTAVDTYEGDAALTTTDTWIVFTSLNVDKDFKGTPEKDAVYIKLKTRTDNLYFKLAKLTPENLELIYLDRGTTLRFIRK